MQPGPVAGGGGGGGGPPVRPQSQQHPFSPVSTFRPRPPTMTSSAGGGGGAGFVPAARPFTPRPAFPLMQHPQQQQQPPYQATNIQQHQQQQQLSPTSKPGLPSPNPSSFQSNAPSGGRPPFIQQGGVNGLGGGGGLNHVAGGGANNQQQSHHPQHPPSISSYQQPTQPPQNNQSQFSAPNPTQQFQPQIISPTMQMNQPYQPVNNATPAAVKPSRRAYPAVATSINPNPAGHPPFQNGGNLQSQQNNFGYQPQNIQPQQQQQPQPYGNVQSHQYSPTGGAPAYPANVNVAGQQPQQQPFGQTPGYGNANQLPGYGAQPAYNALPTMPGIPSYGVGQPQQQAQQGFAPQVNQLAGTFQGMGIAGGAQQPVGVNLMAGPPSIASFEAPAPTPNILSQAVTPSLHSNSHPSYKRCTLNSIPQTASLLAKSGLPFALSISPYRHVLRGEPEIPVVQAPQIVRCRRCRTYINPWIQFIEQGTRWKCNMCFLSNDVPQFFDWDPENRNRVDRLQRPELTYGVIEFIAPQEYMVRPPQPVVMVFVIDVSYGAVQSGMVAIAAQTIFESLDGIPNTDDRAKIGFITFDSSIHFYNLSSSNTEPQMLIVSDLEQPYMPIPFDLLVSLTDSRPVIDSFLKKLPSLFGSTQQTLSALGKALKSAEKLIGAVGGKIVCLQHALPNHSDGALKMREDPKLLGTPKETVLLQPAIAFFKSFAVDCSPSQISIDLFLFNPQYADVATLSGCVKFTGGSLYYYQGFSGAKQEDATKFSQELKHLLTRPLGLEAVLRIRASKGIKMTTFHGNFFLRSTDLLSLPNVSPDNAYTIELSITEDLKATSVCFQTALLYTTSSGERRIRVLTLCVPVTSSLSEVYTGADQYAIAAMLVKKAVDRSLTAKIEDARDALVYKLAEILSIYKSSFNQASHPQQLMICENLHLLPVFILGMLKNIIFREGHNIPSDLRSYMLALHYVLCPEIALVNIYPRLWSLRDLLIDPSVGSIDENGFVKFPQLLNLSSEKLSRDSIFLLESGIDIFLWIGRSTSPDMLTPFFGVPSIDMIPLGKNPLPKVANDLNTRLHNIINDIRQLRLKQATLYPHLYLVREDGDPALRMLFLSHFVEDRIDTALSYPQFLGSVREKVLK